MGKNEKLAPMMRAEVDFVSWIHIKLLIHNVYSIFQVTIGRVDPHFRAPCTPQNHRLHQRCAQRVFV
jgi:hypothetical protein